MLKVFSRTISDRWKNPPNFRSLVVPISAVIIGAVVIASLMRYLPPIEATSQNVPDGTHILYFRPNLAKNLDISGVDGEWSRLGIQTVNNFEDLRRLSRNKAIDTIMFHRDTRQQLDRKWLREQFRSERVIIGINLTINELSQLVRKSEPDSTWKNGWQGANFFSMMVEVKRPDRGGHFEFSNHLYSPEYLQMNLAEALKLRRD